MKSNRVSYVRGKRMRATLVDANGRPVYGDSSVSVTKGFVTATMTSNIEEGEATTVTNADGDACISEPAVPSFTGYGVEIEFCEVDYAMFGILTGQEIILDAAGNAIGIDEKSTVDLNATTFALEIWTGAALKNGTPSAGSQGQYGYFLLPFLKGGIIGDVTIENGAVSFTVSNMTTQSNSNWGKGPYNVELVSGKPAPLRKGVTNSTHRRMMTAEVAPPVVLPGTTPLLDPSAPAVTSITGTATGLSVAFAPTPTGTDPMWYDFGDGTWDYTPNGSITHVYAEPGTYKAVGYRGSSSATKDVTPTSA